MATRAGWLFMLGLAGCSGGGDGATGEVVVFLEPEANITEGMVAGTGSGEIADGWTVSYDKFVIAFGNVEARRSDNAADLLRDNTVHVLDFVNTPASRLVAARFADVPAVRWDRFSYEVPRAVAGALRDESVSEADHDEMVAGGLTAIIQGRISKAGGMQCRNGDSAACVSRDAVTFRWAVAFPQRYSDCGPEEGDSGFAVPTGGTVTLKPTFHGDHWFLSSHASHENALYAQWIADSDQDQDGHVTLEELAAAPAASVFPSPRYNLGGFPGSIANARDYLEVGLRTMGHFQGEGECPTRTSL